MATDTKSKHSPSATRDPDPTPSAAVPKPIRLLRIQQVQELVGLKKAMIYKLHRDGQFPRSVKITERAVGWVEEEVQRWIAERIDRRG